MINRKIFTSVAALAVAAGATLSGLAIASPAAANQGGPAITFPAEGSVVDGYGFYFQGEAEPGASITLMEIAPQRVINCSNVRVDATGKWSCPLVGTLPDGEYQIQAHYFNEPERVGPVTTFYVSDAPEVGVQPVTVTTPAEGATVGVKPVFAGTGEPGARVSVRDFCSTDVLPDGTWSCESAAETAHGPQQATVTQWVDEIVTNQVTVSFVVADDEDAPFVSPLVAGGAGLLLAAGVGIAALRRRTAAAQL